LMSIARIVAMAGDVALKSVCLDVEKVRALVANCD